MQASDSPEPTPTEDVNDAEKPTPEVNEAEKPTPEATDSPNADADLKDSEEPTPKEDVNDAEKPTPEVNETEKPTPEVKEGETPAAEESKPSEEAGDDEATDAKKPQDSSEEPDADGDEGYDPNDGELAMDIQDREGSFSESTESDHSAVGPEAVVFDYKALLDGRIAHVDVSALHDKGAHSGAFCAPVFEFIDMQPPVVAQGESWAKTRCSYENLTNASLYLQEANTFLRHFGRQDDPTLKQANELYQKLSIRNAFMEDRSKRSFVKHGLVTTGGRIARRESEKRRALVKQLHALILQCLASCEFDNLQVIELQPLDGYALMLKPQECAVMVDEDGKEVFKDKELALNVLQEVVVVTKRAAMPVRLEYYLLNDASKKADEKKKARYAAALMCLRVMMRELVNLGTAPGILHGRVTEFKEGEDTPLPRSDLLLVNLQPHLHISQGNEIGGEVKLPRHPGAVAKDIRR